MSWKQQLFKPKWRNKDADIRLRAVRTEQNPQLFDCLLEIAATDSDSRVRCAAIRRLHRLENILKLEAGETDPEAKNLLRERIHQLAASTTASRPALALRMQVVNSSNDRKLIEHLARRAPEAELRQGAIARIERQGLLGDCSIEDEDAGVRKFAASRITQQTTLKRVIEGLRKRDKVLYAELQKRLHAELLEQADPDAVRTEALNICVALEHLAITPGGRDSAAGGALHTAWQNITKACSPDLTERYQRVCQRLATPVPDQVPEPPNTCPTLSQHSESVTDTTAAPENTAKTTPETTADSAPDSTSESNPAQQLEQAGKLELAQACLAQLQQELENGELHKALLSRTQLQKSEKEFSTSEHKNKGLKNSWRGIHKQLVAQQGRLRELRDWQHWSNNKVRKRLIAEMEILPRADLHPDALLDRIKSLQNEWRALEASEQIPGEKHFSAAPWMWRKFSSAGHLAFDTARPFLDKRSEIQSRHAQSLITFCDHLEQLSQTASPDWTTLGKAINQGRKKLRRLNDIPARERQKLAHKLKTTLDGANALMQTHYGEVEKEKLKLIRAASQLVHVENHSEAIDQAKSLQSRWKSAGSLWRSKEQTLWNQFRGHLDPLFAELTAQHDSAREVSEEKLATQKTLCSDLRSILETGNDLAHQQGRVQGLQDEWKDIQQPDRQLSLSFQQLLQDYQQRLATSRQQAQQQTRQRCWLKSALLHELAQVDPAEGEMKKQLQRVQKAWPEATGEPAIEQSMDEHLRGYMLDAPHAPPSGDLQTLTGEARELCIALEFLAGLPSPEAESTLRMRYQVERLAQSMSGAVSRQSASEEARLAEDLWLSMYALPEPAYSDYGQRVKLAINVINGIK